MQKQDRIYFSGLWHIAGNAKRDPKHYNQLLPMTLEKITGRTLVFYSNADDVFELVSAHCQKHSITLQAERRSVDELPAWHLAERLVACCRDMALDRFGSPAPFYAEKGVAHYWRDLQQSGDEVYRQILAIWLSKVGLVAERASALADPTILAWIDASVSRFKGRRSNWDWSTVTPPTGKLAHYRSPMHYFGAKLPLNASFLCASSDVWPSVKAEFDTSARQAVKMNYGHDEETILADCVRRRPDLFHCVGAPYPPRPRGKVQRLLYDLRYK